jgi:hypothetical protein
MLYQLRIPYQCAMLGSGNPWGEEQLLAKIRKVGGEEAIGKFKAKEAELRTAE